MFCLSISVYAYKLLSLIKKKKKGKRKSIIITVWRKEKLIKKYGEMDWTVKFYNIFFGKTDASLLALELCELIYYE